MELVVPAFALGSLYYVNNKQNEKKKEGFKQRDLPNTNLPDKNYPNEERPKFLGRTALDDVYASSKLSNNNKYTNDGTFTDKYFTPNMNATKSTKNSDVTDNYQNTFKSLTGMDVNKDYFKHNNMVPFFGSKSREQVKEDSSDYLLDNYVGSGSQQITKKEQSSLFSPQENAQWAHGTPNANSFFKSRINPSNKRSNEKPFESEMVAPGLGNGSNGFNSGMMGRDTWLPKSVDELRTTSNMKSGGVSLMNREGPAMSKIVNRGEMGAFEQNRPSRIYENNPDRWFTTTGAEKGRTMRAEPIMRMVNRPETTTDYTGAAVSQVNGEYVPGEYMPSTNINLGPKPTGVPNAIGSNTPVSGEYGLNAKKAYPNNRSVNEQPNYFGNIGTSVTAAVSPLLDILRPSRKENAIGNLRPYQNPGTTVSQTYMFNPADRTKTTHRETMEESKQNFNINANQLGGAYRTTQHQVSYTTRNETGDFYYSGNAEGAKEMKSFEAEKNQRNNEIKSSTIAGRMNPGNMSLLNSDVNITQRNRDHLLKNSRELSGNGPSRAPTTENMGMLAGKDNSLYSNLNMDRTNKDLLHALKSNPYVTNYKNAL
tara:strand:- start:5026 stop:6810 length:1785 start_codon:yes stop_codon:yes gene_type:complete